MRFSRSPALWTCALSLPSLVAALTIDCEHIRASKVSFDLSKLKGVHTVTSLEESGVPGKYTNKTFTIDICEPIPKLKNDKTACNGTGTRVCAVQSSQTKLHDDDPDIVEIWPVAGGFVHEGRHLNPEWTRLKDSTSHADREVEGLRLVMEGGLHEKTKNKAVIDFICDRNKTGLEGEEKSNRRRQLRSREEGDDKGDDNGDDKGDDGDNKLPNPNAGKSLEFINFGPQGNVEVLDLKWYTKYACEDQKGKKDDDSDGEDGNRSWGFFTWFIIILFLAVAAYLIFGSWLNYNRYGARGWDLLPHGDTIRDLPYLIKDWGRRVVSTIQGGGSRDLGGYIRV